MKKPDVRYIKKRDAKSVKDLLTWKNDSVCPAYANNRSDRTPYIEKKYFDVLANAWHELINSGITLPENISTKLDLIERIVEHAEQD